MTIETRKFLNKSEEIIMITTKWYYIDLEGA